MKVREPMRQVVKCFMVNSAGEDLLLKRAATDTHGSKWETAGGGINDGENIFDAAVRETLEETGIETDFFLEGADELVDDQSGEWFTVYMFRSNKVITDPVCISKDHSDYIWLDLDKIDDFIAKGNVIDRWTLIQLEYYRYVFDNNPYHLDHKK